MESGVKRLVILGILCLVSDSCNGGGVDPFYGGVWDVSYNLTLDECGLVGEDTLGFEDVHRINYGDSTITLVAESGILNNGVGTIRFDDSLLATEEINGDILGNGVTCVLRSYVTYFDLREDRASSLSVFRIDCPDDFHCSSEATGTAVRRADA